MRIAICLICINIVAMISLAYRLVQKEIYIKRQASFICYLQQVIDKKNHELEITRMF